MLDHDFFRNNILALPDDRLPKGVVVLGKGGFGKSYRVTLGQGNAVLVDENGKRVASPLAGMNVVVKVMLDGLGSSSDGDTSSSGSETRSQRKAIDALTEWQTECYMLHLADQLETVTTLPKAIPWDSVLDPLRPVAPQIFGCYEAHGGYVVVMEYVDGLSPHQMIKDRTRMAPPLVVLLFCQTVEFFMRLHTRNVYYNDMSYNNLMFQADGRLRVIDWGAACNMLANRSLADTHQLVCTLVGTHTDAFNSPERFQGLWNYLHKGVMARVQNAAVMQKADMVAIAMTFTFYLQQRQPSYGELVWTTMDPDTSQPVAVGAADGQAEVVEGGRIPLPDLCYSLDPALQSRLNQILAVPLGHELDMAAFLKTNAAYFREQIAAARQLLQGSKGFVRPRTATKVVDERAVRGCRPHRYIVRPYGYVAPSPAGRGGRRR
jgi:tRNA A-37 threonylcarbamoyl transferase component Bud32